MQRIVELGEINQKFLASLMSLIRYVVTLCFCLFPSGDVKAASSHLCQVFGQEPRDAAAQARLGVVETWQQKDRSRAAYRLSKVTEKDSSTLDFLLALIPFNQRKCMAQVSLCAGNLRETAAKLLFIYADLENNSCR